ncbi:MAG: hypothetical protein F6K03_01970, partial [Kamptonema sp. SIO4C4]|nr:hypothetical protein [Kamptonema sp. SIO4C4]
MNNIWILTTGSSDVQLKTEDNWRTLHRKVRSDLETNKQFSSVTSEQTGQKRWLYPARAVGRFYSSALDQHYSDLDFPLLNPFVEYLKEKEVPLDCIVVILTDQSEVVRSADKKDPSHPFWQDTCTLLPILEKFLQSHFSQEPLILTLKPNSGSVGLDDWNEVLSLVQAQFSQLVSQLEIPDDATVYVSHQAGTPAISSAVQFESLALFGKRVKFLVSNEQNPELTRVIDRSSYLKRIRRQEALALLNNYDYSGMYQLLQEDLQESEREEDRQILQKLEMAMRWNFAKFQEVLEFWFQVPPEEAEDWWRKNWWRPVFESAFLAKVRFKQGNIVEAFFNSFRAVEAAFLEWGKQEFKAH